MQDAAMRWLAALFLAALLTIFGAVLTISFLAADEQAAGNTGNVLGSETAIRGGDDNDQQYGSIAYSGHDGNDMEIY